jgi:hypothetical protein
VSWRHVAREPFGKSDGEVEVMMDGKLKQKGCGCPGKSKETPLYPIALWVLPRAVAVLSRRPGAAEGARS